MTPVVVPRCGRIGCDEDRRDRRHAHKELGIGDRVVVEPKRPTAPGWAFGTPAATIAGANGKNLIVTLDDGRELEVAVDLVTRWHSWRKRPQPAPRLKLLPPIPKSKQIDPALGVVEPPLFEEL